MGAPLLETAAVLDEVPPPEGFALWRLLQDVTLWVKAPAEERAGLYPRDLAPLRGLPSIFGLELPIAALHARLRTDDARAEEVAAGCVEVARWCAEQRRFATAVLFAQAAADALPEDAARAHHVAMLARHKGDFHRAEVWYWRAVALARQGQDWQIYARCFDGLGRVYRSQGKLPSALRLHGRALRSARNYRIRRVQAEALHNLSVVCFELDRPEEGLAYARAAFQAFGPHHPSVPILAQDLAYFWMEQGAFARALPIFQQVLRHVREPVERLFVLANTARAVGGAGEHATFEHASGAVWNALSQVPDAGVHAAALVELARGALDLGLTEPARRAASRALALAEERSEQKLRAVAESLLDAAASASTPRSLSPQGAPATPGRDLEPEDRFAEELVSALLSAYRS